MANKNLVFHLISGLFRQLDAAGTTLRTRLNITVYCFNLTRAMIGPEDCQKEIALITEQIAALREGYSPSWDEDQFAWDSSERVNYENLLDDTNFLLFDLINTKIPINESTMKEWSVGRGRGRVKTSGDSGEGGL